MEHRDQRQESHGVHVCNKCGWPFPNPHPSAKHRRAHKRVCGTIEGFKLVVESEANTLLTISDDDGDQKSSSPKVLGGSCDDKGVDGMKKKSKDSEDEVFSDAVTEFSESVGPDKFVGEALDPVSSLNMEVDDSSQTLKDREVLETTINQSGSEQESIINQESVNLETDSRTLLSSSATENQKVGNLVVTYTAIDRSGNGQETQVDQELVNLETDFGTPSSSSSTENRKVEILVVSEATINQSGTEQETKINQEFVNLETNIRTGDSVVSPNDHMNSTTASDLYPIEPETIIPAPQQERNIDSVENVPQCSLLSPDRRCDEKKGEDLGLCKNLAKITAASGKMDNDKSEPEPKMEETIEEVSTEDLGLCKNLAEIAAASGKMDNDKSEPEPKMEETIEEVPTEDLGLCKNLAEIAAASGKMDNDKSEPEPKMEETIEEIPTEPFAHNVTLQSVVVNGMSVHPEMVPSVVVSNVKPIDLTQVTSDARKELESCSSNSLQETDKIKEENGNVHLSSVSGELNGIDHPEALVEDSNNHKEVKLTNCVEGIGGFEDNFKDPEESYSTFQAEPFDQASEVASFDMKTVESRQKPESGGDNVSVDVKADCSLNSGQEIEEIPIQQVKAAQIEGRHGEKEEHDKSQTLSDTAKFGIDSPGRNSEDTVQVHLPVDAHERKDDGVGEKDKFDNLDIAGVEDKNDPLEELFSIGIDSRPESTTNSRENECIAVGEVIAEESLGKFSGTESTASRKSDTSLASGTQQSVKEDDHCSSVHVACISEVVNSDDQSCHLRDFNSSNVHANKEANLVSVGNESVTGRSEASQVGSVSQLVGDAVKIAPESWKDDDVKINVKPQLTPSLFDASVDVSSRTDSLEGNWGSISVLSTQSDLPAVDGEVTLQARAEAEETDLKKADAATERQHSDRSELFEPPSFMTLVEPNAGGIQNSATSEIQTARNQQQQNSVPLQAGWFPSYTHVANDSPGRKKNEAIIAKVTNWSTGKPHTALKNLLDDAALENKKKSPTRKENLASMIQKDEKVTKNGSIDKTVDTVMRPKSPTTKLGNKEIANEWNSPARYPSDIKRERRKGRPYWAQFVCCSSSVH